MAVTHLTVHHLSRSPEDAPVEVQMPPEALQVTADTESLIGHYKRLFNTKPGKQFGRFHDDTASYPGGAWTREFVDGKISFAQWARHLTEELVRQLGEIPVELDIYLIYAQEQVEKGRRLHILGTETDSGFTFTETPEIEPIEYLNQSRLDIAARLDVDDWLADPEGNSALCLLAARNAAKVGEAFARAVGFQNATNIEQDTATFLDAIERFCHQTDEQKASLVRKKAYDFVVEQHKLGEPVEFSALSEVVDEEAPDRFAEFARQELPEAEHPLRPDYRKLRKLVKFSGKGNGISLSFSSDLMERSILYDPQDNALIIRDIPKTLKEQLSQYLEQKRDTQ